MSFEEALNNFIVALEMETGIREPVTKIGLDRRAFDHVVYSLAQRNRYAIGMSTIADGGLRVMGIELVARDKDKF